MMENAKENKVPKMGYERYRDFVGVKHLRALLRDSGYKFGLLPLSWWRRQKKKVPKLGQDRSRNRNW